MSNKQIKNEQGIPIMVVNGDEYRIQFKNVNEKECNRICGMYTDLGKKYATIMQGNGYYTIGVK